MVLIWVIGLNLEILERIMQGKVNQQDGQGNRHGYWETNEWLGNFIHGKIIGYSEDFSYTGKVINKEFYARY